VRRMEWISVYDSLPPVDEPVWVYWRDRKVLIGWKSCLDSDPANEWYCWEDGKFRWTYWWMPISGKPTPPTEDGAKRKPPLVITEENKNQEKERQIVFKRYGSLVNITEKVDDREF
jgi:hypothetical protein